MTDLVVVEEVTSVVITDDEDVDVAVVTNETTLELTDNGPQGPAGPSTYPFPFTMSEDLEVKVGESMVVIQHAGYEIEGISMWVNTPSLGSDVVVDVNVNDTSIFTDQSNRPRVAPGVQDGGFVIDMDVTMLSPGDRLSVDVDEVGSLTPGRWLTVTIWLRRTSA